jgi:hypothetical protein
MPGALFARFRPRNLTLGQNPQVSTIDLSEEVLLGLKKKDSFMVKKPPYQGKPTVPSGGPKPGGMKKPANGQSKMVAPKSKVGKKGR